MGVEALKSMKDRLVHTVQGQLVDISNVDAKELGEAVDMIKDLAEAIYYCTITDAMQGTDEKQKQPINNINYYTAPSPMTGQGGNSRYMYYTSGDTYGYPYNGNMDSSGMMGNGGRLMNNNSTYGRMNMYTELDGMMRDPRQGRSPMRRRMYMEGKQQHHDPNSQMKELEAYLQELSTDITEMVKDASPEQRATLRQKMTMLADKLS